MSFRVWGLGSEFWGFGVRISGFGSGFLCLGFRFSGSGCQASRPPHPSRSCRFMSMDARTEPNTPAQPSIFHGRVVHGEGCETRGADRSGIQDPDGGASFWKSFDFRFRLRVSGVRVQILGCKRLRMAHIRWVQGCNSKHPYDCIPRQSVGGGQSIQKCARKHSPLLKTTALRGKLTFGDPF